MTPTPQLGSPRHAQRARVAWSLLVSIACAALVLLGTVIPALAADGKTIAVYVEGPDAALVRADVLALAPKALTVVEASRFSAALQKAGQRGEMGNLVAVKAQRDRLLSRIRKAATDVQADAVVIGRVRPRKGGGKEVWLLFVDAMPGDLALDEAVALPADGSDRRTALGVVLKAPFNELAPPPPPPPPPPPEPVAEEKKDEPKREAHDESTSLFKVGVALDLGGRWFSYHDGLSANLRPYSVFPAPILALSGEVYPAATTGIRVLKDLGVRARFGHAFGLKSATKDGAPIETQWNRFAVDLHGRLRTGEGYAPVLGAAIGFEWIAFWFNDAGAIANEVPGASYKNLRLGLDARIPIGRVGLGFDVAYLAPLSTGAVYERFKDPSVKGVDLGFKVGVGIWSGLMAEVGLDYTRYFSSFGPVPGDAYVAGGALDQLLALRLGLAYVY
jgi:hypothetical protein